MKNLQRADLRGILARAVSIATAMSAAILISIAVAASVRAEEPAEDLGDSITVTGGVPGGPSAPAGATSSSDNIPIAADTYSAPAPIEHAAVSAPLPARTAVASQAAPAPAASAPVQPSTPTAMPIAPEAVAIAPEPPTRTAEVVASNKASAIGAPVPDTSLAPVAEQAAPAHVQLEGVTLTPVAATFAPSIPAVPVDEPVPPEVLAANQAPIAQANAGDGAEMQQVASKQGDGGGMPFAGLGMTTNKGPVDIKSDSLSYDSQQHIATFSGHVHAVQADGSLSADNLRVVYGGEDFHEVKTMYADGNVRLGQGTRWATGDHGVLDNTKRTVVMTGSPVVHDGNDEITGRRITTFLDSGRSVVEGARAVIYPKSKNENPEASSSPASASN